MLLGTQSAPQFMDVKENSIILCTAKLARVITTVFIMRALKYFPGQANNGGCCNDKA